MSREKNNTYDFVAVCSAGLEDLVAEEVNENKGKVFEKEVGMVCWQGGLVSGYRLCLWSRYASRIFLKIHEGRIQSNEDIFALSLGYDWTGHLDCSKTFSIRCSCAKDACLSNSQYAALKVKDGISDFFRNKTGRRPNVAKERADVRIHVYVEREKASFFIDFSGEALHRRGYRVDTGIAPIKENVAAAIVAMSGWSKNISSECVFLDPMCGSGTLLIEAALLFGDSAPGLSRKYNGFQNWLGHDEMLWSSLVEEAIAREEAGDEKQWPKIIGYDCDPQMVRVARKNIISAGLQNRIEVRQQEVAFLERLAEEGYVVSNLPYGERLSSKEEIGFIYQGIAQIFRRKLNGWRMGMLVSDPDFLDVFPCQNVKNIKLYNGPISCRLSVGNIVGEKENQAVTWGKTGYEDLNDGLDLFNRLQKNCKKLQPWAEKNSISCFRIYDRDLPEYNFAIDVYGKYFLVQEYAPAVTIDEELARKRFSLALHVIRTFFNTGRERVFVRQRKRQRGKEQYQKKEGKIKFYQVFEGDCCFLVNFTNYLDVGLFLDHRPIRKKLAEITDQNSFLNLFAYTGTASVHAARGGAVATTTVDLSSQYIQWAKNNFLLNGLNLENHEFVQQDCLAWLKQNKKEYDVIFIDPPTFSNTKKKGLLFDVQRDHSALIYEAARVLTDSGVLYFSTNFKGFKLDTSIEEDFIIKNISKETVPFDFQRNGSIHKCWEIRKNIE